MEYTQRLVVGVVLVLTSVIQADQGGTIMLGPLQRAKISSSQNALQKFGTGNAIAMQALINKYGPYKDLNQADTSKNAHQALQNQLEIAIKAGSFDTIIQEYAALLEGFFAHLGLLFDASVIPVIDQTRQQTINSAIILNSGLPPLSKQVQSATSLPECCGELFSVSRYIRGFGSSSSLSQNNVMTLPTRAIDSFYGVIFLNGGWYNASTGQNNWISSWLNISSFGQNITTIKQNEAGIARVAGGVDGWPSSENGRVLSVLFTTQEGSDSLSPIKTPAQIIVTQAINTQEPTITLVAPNGTRQVVSNPQGFFTGDSLVPWALVVESTNPQINGAYSPLPQLVPKALVKLNPYDFPLQYQMPKGSSSQVVTSGALMEGLLLFAQQIQDLPKSFTQQTVTQTLSVGNCSDYSATLTVSTQNSSDMYMPAINTALAKYNGVMQYQWGTNYTIKDALIGGLSIARQLFMTKSILNFNNLLIQIAGKERLNGVIKEVKRNSSFFPL